METSEPQLRLFDAEPLVQIARSSRNVEEKVRAGLSTIDSKWIQAVRPELVGWDGSRRLARISTVSVVAASRNQASDRLRRLLRRHLEKAGVAIDHVRVLRGMVDRGPFPEALAARVNDAR